MGKWAPAKVAAPGKLTMIDPTMGAVGELTDMCDGRPWCAEHQDAEYEPCRRGVYSYHADDGSLSHELPCVQFGWYTDLLRLLKAAATAAAQAAGTAAAITAD